MKTSTETNEFQFTCLDIKNYITPYIESGKVIIQMVKGYSEKGSILYSENGLENDLFYLQYEKLNQLVDQLEECKTNSLKEDHDTISFLNCIAIVQDCLYTDALVKIISLFTTLKLFRRK